MTEGGAWFGQRGIGGAQGTHKGCPYTGHPSAPPRRFTPMPAFLQYGAKGVTHPS